MLQYSNIKRKIAVPHMILFDRNLYVYAIQEFYNADKNVIKFN